MKVQRSGLFVIAAMFVALNLCACSESSENKPYARPQGAAQRSAPIDQVRANPRLAGTAQDPGRWAKEVAGIMRSSSGFADSYSRLSRSAEAGNAEAAYQLYENTLRCGNVALRREIFEAEAAKVPRSSQAMEARIIEDDDFCTGATDAQLSSKAGWVARAARLGHVQAQLAFFGATTEKFDTPDKIVAGAEELSALKREALQHLQSAARKGNDTALFNLAMAYQEGTLVGREPVVAYAYMLTLKNKGSTRSAEKYLDTWARDMTAEQVLRAKLLADSLGDKQGGR